YHEVSHTDVLHRHAEVGDVGSMGAWGIFEFDWARLQSCLIFDLSAAGSDWWHSAT
ncbi:MAG: hypothetical protein ACI9TZ_003163, partial [Yoonia sp.]